MKEYQLFILELYFPPINHHRKRGGEKSAKAGKWEREESPGQQPESEFNPAPIGALQGPGGAQRAEGWELQHPEQHLALTPLPEEQLKSWQ